MRKVVGLALCCTLVLSGCTLCPWSAREQPDWGTLTPYRHRGLKSEGPSTRTTFYRENDNLIVKIVCNEPDMGKLIARIKEHDNVKVFEDDSIEVFIATESDNYFQLIANTLGAVYDIYITPLTIVEWDSHAQVAVEKGENFYQVTLTVPLENLMSEASASPWKINICRNRRTCSPMTYYTLTGWYHRPEEWLEVDILGKKKIDVASLLPASVELPEPRYDMDRLQALHPDLQWIREEKLRVYCGWAMDCFRYRRNNGKHTVYDFLDKVAEAKFNVAVVGTTPPLGWIDGDYTFDCACSGALYARLKGLKVIWHASYLDHATYEEVGKKYPATVNRKGVAATRAVCPVDGAAWEKYFRTSVLRALRWEKDNKLDLSIGVWIDVEPQYQAHECYCDQCFDGFVRHQGLRPAKALGYEERFPYLLEKKLVEEYQQYLQDSLVAILRPLRRKTIKAFGKPSYLFAFYPGHVFGRGSWVGLAMAKALGRREVPVMIWDDEMYWNGYTGSHHHIARCQDFLRKTLGYEALYMPSIDYFTYAKYPSYTPERADRELYLLNRSSPGTFCYGEARKGKPMWESHMPFFPAFKRMNERLKREGHIRSLGLQPPENPERLKKVKAVIDRRIVEFLKERKG